MKGKSRETRYRIHFISWTKDLVPSDNKLSQSLSTLKEKEKMGPFAMSVSAL